VVLTKFDQLFVSLYEWRTGKYRTHDFSANMFQDVYNGHIGTLMDIKKKNLAAFNSMLVDIYMQARYVSLIRILRIGMTAMICQRSGLYAS
jgi:hypothetical protein